MTIVMPRLDRDSAAALIKHHRHAALNEIEAAMPDLTPVPTYSPVGGARIEQGDLESLREAVMTLAREHGMPQPGAREHLQVFEGRAARVLHERLPMTPHEASQEEVWSYVTCCWLLDVAIWRFGAETSDDRFIGHLNRNTFRRMWWRAEILGADVDLTRLGEDELVNIMERPTLSSDRRLARAIALEFLDRVERGIAPERMRLMREATKRVLRLTPFVALSALDDHAVGLFVSDAFDAAAAGLAGESLVIPPRVSQSPRQPSSDVTNAPVMTFRPPSDEADPTNGTQGSVDNFDEIAQAALDIVRRTGMVTTQALREVVPITSDEAREVFRVLIERGELARRGVKRGTHYVLPDSQPRQQVPEPSPGRSVPPPPRPSPRAPARPRQSQAETALRRLLRRGPLRCRRAHRPCGPSRPNGRGCDVPAQLALGVRARLRSLGRSARHL